MGSLVSVPEKTLEHWASQYVTYRYRSKAGLWWPTRGQDIDLDGLPNWPGKVIQFELKTTTVTGRHTHDVIIDLGQLWDYHQRPLGLQPFYVMPYPDWTGTLQAAATNAGRSVTELGFSRSGANWWFADWMIVLTTMDIATVLAAPLAAHGQSKRGVPERLVRFDFSAGGTHPVLTWGNGAPQPTFTAWLEFWPLLESCGRPGWPQLVRLPARDVDRSRYTRSEIAKLLRRAARRLRSSQWEEEELVTLEPDAEGRYLVQDESHVLEEQPVEENEGETDDHRQLVYLDASALQTREAH